MWLTRRNPFIAFTTEEAGAGTGGGSLEDAADAQIQAAVDAGLRDDADDGDEPPPPGQQQQPAQQQPGDADSMQYRDAQQLRDELKRDRERWRPYEQAFGGLDDDQRQALLELAPNLGGDLALLAQSAGQMHPDDRRWLAAVGQLLVTDPAAAAAELARGADLLRQMQDQGAQQQQPANIDDLDDDTPLTRAEAEALFRRQWEEQQFARDVDDAERQILDQVKGLGYDPDAEPGTPEAVQFETLVSLARSLDGDFDKAHEALQGAQQYVIDQFVAGKKADASRPGATTVGASPSQQRTLETPADMEAAAEALLEANGIPASRR